MLHFPRPLQCAAAVLTLTCLATGLHANPRVLVGHMAPFANSRDGTSVTVRVNGSAVLENFKFRDFTPAYLALPAAGRYTLEVLPTGTTTVAISATVDLAANTDYTVLAIGDGVNQPLSLLPLVDDNSAPMAGSLKLRVVHAAPFGSTEAATAVSIRTDAGAIVGGLANVPYPVASGYLTLPAARYNLKVSTPDGSQNLIDAAPVDLPAGAVLTVVAVGDGRNQSLGFVALPLGDLAIESPVAQQLTGQWIDPNANDQGFNYTSLPREDRATGQWYAFDNSGRQIWYYLDSCQGTETDPCPGAGTLNGNGGSFAIYEVTGGRFGVTAPVTKRRAGTLSVQFRDCNTLTLSYNFNLPTAPVSTTLNRLTPALACP